MFFSINTYPLDNFDQVHKFDRLYVGVDAGWTLHETATHLMLYKGYCDTNTMSNIVESVIEQTEPTLLGNFCFIIMNKQTGIIKIKTDLYRSFPIYYRRYFEVTNLIPSEHVVWTNNLIEMDQELDVIVTKFNTIGTVNDSLLSVDEVIDSIDQIMDRKVLGLMKNNHLPVRVYLSGGVDSLLVYSYLQKHNVECDRVKYNHVDHDKFWMMNSYDITRNWGYQQIHHWVEPTMLVSGAPGDEFMLRNPVTGDQYLKFRNMNMLELLKQPHWYGCYHYSYFCREKNMAVFRDQDVPTWRTAKEMIWHLCNNVINDWQHWHIGNTLTWTPLRDLEILKLMLRLPVEDALGQLMDCRISKEIIRRNSPELLNLLSEQKNTSNLMRNIALSEFRE